MYGVTGGARVAACPWEREAEISRCRRGGADGDGAKSYSLPEKTWFVVLLVGGVLSFVFAPIGFAVMVAYVVAAPDGTLYRQSQAPTAASQPGSLAPTT